ncbi:MULTISPECIES: hypothetical protein [Raoultella]|uniref:hypothetical protein n=1 Tax=Raoultella TaxID=160674 RepID=UPI0013310B90|nr:MULTISPECIES: hypothetical protein [Raoultella]
MIYITFQIGGLGLNLLTVEQTPSTSWRGQQSYARYARQARRASVGRCRLASDSACLTSA